MKPKTKKDSSILGARTTLALILATYGIMVAVLLYDLRGQLRSESMNRASVATTSKLNGIYDEVEREAIERDLDFLELGMTELLHDSRELLEETALRTLEIAEVNGALSYDEDGNLLASFSNKETETKPSKEDFKMANNEAFHQKFIEPSSELLLLQRFGEDAAIGFLLLELDARPLAAEFEALDGNLLRQGLLAFLCGGGLILLVCLVFMRRLRQSQKALSERTEKLKETNDRLAQACKSAGIGAITSHLMHALKNPLAGLREYAREQKETGDDDETAILLTEATDRMQTMVEDTLGTLSETEADEATYSFSVAEILELTRQRLESSAEKANVKMIIENDAPESELDNLRANLLVPILLNLGQNAIDASAKGVVKLEGRQEAGNLEFRIRDDGRGVPEKIRERLFRPIQSTKPGGSGVGLAICRELAHRIDAAIELESVGSTGSCFLIRIDETKT